MITHHPKATVPRIERAIVGPTVPALAISRDRSRNKQYELSVDATRRLTDFAKRESLPVNAVLTGAWALVLSRYSGDNDIAFGATITARTHALTEPEFSAGFVSSQVPIRIAIDPNMRVADWLRDSCTNWIARTGATTGVPAQSDRNAEAVSPPPRATLVIYENQQSGTRLADRGRLSPVAHVSKVDGIGIPVTLSVQGDEPLIFKFTFDAHRFDEATIDRTFGHLATMLDDWTRNPELLVFETSMLSPTERNTMLDEWNDTESPYPRDEALSALIEKQVALTPDAPAVTFEEVTLSYAELNARANRLARELQRHGAEAEVLVGIALERSTDTAVALLAVMKTGAAYVPLDPAFPRERLAYMMEDCSLTILVTQQSVRAALPDVVNVVLEMDAPTWDDADSDNLGVLQDAESLAHVIYTSGSTGTPKGVQINRSSLANLLWCMREWLALSAADRVLALTTISFDIAGLELWLPWMVGAHVIVAERTVAAQGERVSELLRTHDITFLQATPATWRQLRLAEWDGKDNLQAVCTGEAMPKDIAVWLVPRVPRLWNLYGPTETTIWSTGTPISASTERIPIGRPIANTQCYILDTNLQPVPVGVTGELYIGGAGVARGYRNRPDLDEEKFVRNPFVDSPSARMYRTGDLAQFRSDGTIECLGRTDHQVKIRGFRIEPGEIENVLLSHPDVRQVVVVARERTPGDTQLTAYVVAERTKVDFGSLRTHMKKSLPEYMVPAAIVALEDVPLTANGKIDRRSLPAPESTPDVAKMTTVNARTHVERQLCDIWEELFEVPTVGVTDNFFDLGGHSLLAASMMARVSRAFGKQLPLNALLGSPTIEQLAKFIDDADDTMGRHTLVRIQVAGNRPPLFWIPGGAAVGLFRLRHIVRQLGADQPVYALGSNYPASFDDIETVEQRSRKYLELVRRVQPKGPYSFVGFCAGGSVAYELAQQLTAAGDAVAFVGMINCPFPDYPSRPIDKVWFKAQRLRFKYREARSNGQDVVTFVRNAVNARRNARVLHQSVDAAVVDVSGAGFQPHLMLHHEALLKETTNVFERYRPSRYGGPISLFMSDDEDYTGVSRRLDPRFMWTKYAATSRMWAFPGGHNSAFESSDSRRFTEALKAALHEALPAHNTQPLRSRAATNA